MRPVRLWRIGAIGAPLLPSAGHISQSRSALVDPIPRWREQAEALVAGHPDEDREDLLHLFEEREAIASVDGGQDDYRAGRLAYEALNHRLREQA